MALDNTEADLQADPLPTRSVDLCVAPKCLKCGRAALVLPSITSRICERCMLAWAFEPCEVPVAEPEPEPSWSSDAPGLGPYVVLEEIGRGGMGVIYRAVHRETHEVVALKTILPQYADDAETVARFRREAETAQGLEHPHTMPILAVGSSDEGVPFFAMPLALGGGLHQLKARYHRRWRRIAELMVKVSRAVHHAHTRGVLHRDIKPSNVLFTEEHEPVVTDFGLAKPLGDTDDLTRPCAVLGTPNYVAPEQAAGQTLELTAAADVYSLGAVLFELLTGRPPFVGDNPLDVLRQLGTKSPVPPRHLLLAVPKALDRICLRCLQRLPANRYVSARALADDLERWLDGRAVSRLPIHTRLLNSFKARPHVGWWCGVVGVLALALPAWKFTGSAVSARPPTSMAIVVDELAPNSTSRLIAQQLTGEFKQSLANSHKFCLQEEISIGRSANVALSNSLTYGRAVHAQTMLTCRVRQAGDQVHLSAQFVRCDTGELLWKRRVVLPTERAVMYLPATTQTMVQDLTKDWSNGFQGSRLTNFNPLPDAQTFYTRAMELASHGNRRDLEAAITLFERARQADPHYSQACAMLAFARWTLGCSYGEDDQLASAESTAKVALALDPDCAQAHRVIASCYLQQVRLDEARQEFEAAAELDPESAGCCQSLGICLRQMGHPDQAIPWLQRAVRIDPARGVCNTSLGEALILCDLDEQAEEAMCRAAELTTEKPDTQFGLVALRVWQKRYDEARGLCTVARSRFPEYQYALNFAAWIEFCDGRLSKARALYAELLANNSYQKQWVFHGGINPASALAYIAFRSGSVEQARSLADQAMRIDQELLARYPNNCRILHDMAATCAVIGNEQNALRYLEQSLAAGWAEHRSTMIDPRFGDIAGLPSFEALLKSTKPKYAANESLQR